MSSTTVVSAPGKVLIAGGYLVLDPLYSGVVVSTSSRFYAVIDNTRSPRPLTIRVRSPQFQDATWSYAVVLNGSAPVIEPSKINASKNKFVHLALQHTIALAVEARGVVAIQDQLAQGLDIAVVGDNDFYSQRDKIRQAITVADYQFFQLESLGAPRTIGSPARRPPFNPIGLPLSNVHKTGLGSSAALITSLTSALLVHLLVIPPSALSLSSSSDTISEGRRLAHNLAQFVHCLAQGKVGSGFDVSAAVFGSHLYTRFDPSVIQDLMSGSSGVVPSLLPALSPSNPAWNYRVEPFKLPPYTRIILGDVDAGSDTPSLAGKVLKWRKEKPEEAEALWKHLDQLNQSLGQTLLHLSKLHDQDPENYRSGVKYISTLQPLQWEANPLQPPAEQPIVNTFYQAHRISQEIRAKMKEMGNRSGVPIEPDEQTRLLDVCVGQAGVIGGGVPGAGGYDAIWLLVCDPDGSKREQTPLERIEHIWSIYKELNVSPLSSTENVMRGIRLEQVHEVPGLRNILSAP